GRLLIFGTNFGSTQGSGQVLISGFSAIATTWTNTEIHAYVPEASAIGSVPVQVITSAGAGNSVMLNVTLRQADGRVLWRFQIDSTFGGEFEAVAPDGTVYVTDLFRLYALSSDGGLLWVAVNAGRRRPISLGADGTIYTAGNLLKALNPDGTLKWELPNQDPGLDLRAGPNVGPDGNIYAVQNSLLGGGLGVFSLDPDGNLLWANEGQEGTGGTASSNSDIVFGTDRLFMGLTGTNNTPILWSFGLDGNPLWNGGNNDLSLGSRNFPKLDPSGRVIVGWGQTAIQAITPDGGVDWLSFHPDGINLPLMPGIDSNGVIYTGPFSSLMLWAINPDGSTRWTVPASSGLLDALNVPPDGSIILAGGSGGFGQPGRVRAYDTANGVLLWQVDLLSEGGVNQHVNSQQPTFTPDSQTAYFTSVFSGNTGISYVYAIRTGDEIVPIPGDINGDGMADMNDVPVFAAVLVGTDTDPNHVVASDLNGDGAPDGQDTQPFVGALLGG
ncbi:MAG: PQQ-binding-like beta-propeller repeat protein, partial [Phycisphaerae bacterium]